MDAKFHTFRSMAGGVAISLLWLGITVAESSGQINLERPGDREFIRDLAGILDEKSKEEIKSICDKLLNEKATPIIVVTIESMSDYGGAGMQIESFATILFNQWGIGHEKLGEEYWNTGILLLISRDDRKARIELGGGWGRREDGLCRQIMDEQIIFYFKQQKFSEGILAGVQALDKMARKLELPSRPTPWWIPFLVVGFIGLAIFTAVSLYRNGSSGYAWILWAAIFAIVGFLLYALLTSRGGGSGGGSFGGGSSGGGGATGSW